MTTNNNWQDLAADLPAPRDDEPQSLRDDIVAELQDHLACALHRERHATGDEDRAQKNVIEKFGNPAAIAYRLWRDAMKERIMSQRILIGTVLLLAIACLAATGFAWIAVQEGREVNQLVMANSQSMMETNRTMMEKLTALAVGESKETDAPDPMQWVPVKAKVVLGEPNGPPAIGAEVSLTGKLLGSDEMTITERVDADGEVSLGYVRPGNCTMTVLASGGRHIRYFTVMPASPREELVVCPSGPMKTTDIKFEVKWPDDLREKSLGLVLAFHYGPRIVDSKAWAFSEIPDAAHTRGYLLLKSPQGNVSDTHALIATEVSMPSRMLRYPDQNREGASIAVVVSPRAHTLQSELKVAQATMKKSFLGTVLLAEDGFEDFLDGNERLGELDVFPLLVQWPRSMSGEPDLWHVLPSLKDSVEGLITDEIDFVPKPGEENVWTIELPESLIARTREALQAIDDFKAEHAAAEATTE